MTRGKVGMNWSFGFVYCTLHSSSTTNKVPIVGMVHVCRGDVCIGRSEVLEGKQILIYREKENSLLFSSTISKRVWRET